MSDRGRLSVSVRPDAVRTQNRPSVLPLHAWLAVCCWSGYLRRTPRSILSNLESDALSGLLKLPTAG